MIAVAEIRGLAAEWSIREDVIEKDYVLGWLLAAIAAQPELQSGWVFKGGTCLRKCYHETYRCSRSSRGWMNGYAHASASSSMSTRR